MHSKVRVRYLCALNRMATIPLDVDGPWSVESHTLLMGACGSLAASPKAQQHKDELSDSATLTLVVNLRELIVCPLKDL